MRLSDADAILAEAMADGAYGYVDAKQIADAPTIDDVPVKHGEWIHDRQLYRCSACGELWLHWNDLVPLEQMYRNCPHCPMCGAKMDWRKPDD